MKVNPKIKEVIDEIAKETVIHFNSDKSFKVSKLRKLYRFFKNNLTEEEQLYIIYHILENIHYKNILVDPETLITVSNIKLRYIFFIVVSVIFVMVVFAILFKTNPTLNHILEIFSNVISIIKFAGDK